MNAKLRAKRRPIIVGSFILFLPIRFYAKRCVQQRRMVPGTAVALKIRRWIKPPNREAVVIETAAAIECEAACEKEANNRGFLYPFPTN